MSESYHTQVFVECKLDRLLVSGYLLYNETGTT